MARAFRPITGNITKLNDPYFAEQRGMWVMMVKENDRWLAINSRDEAKIRAYHHQLETQRTASTLNVRVQATTLEGNWLRAAEFSAGMLEQAKVSDPHQMMTAVETHIRVKQEAERVPPTAEACDLFIAKQEKRNLSSCTIRDYKRLARDLKATFSDRNLSTITSNEITAFIEQKKHPVAGTINYGPLRFRKDSEASEHQRESVLRQLMSRIRIALNLRGKDFFWVASTEFG